MNKPNIAKPSSGLGEDSDSDKPATMQKSVWLIDACGELLQCSKSEQKNIPLVSDTFAIPGTNTKWFFTAEIDKQVNFENSYLNVKLCMDKYLYTDYGPPNVAAVPLRYDMVKLCLLDEHLKPIRTWEGRSVEFHPTSSNISSDTQTHRANGFGFAIELRELLDDNNNFYPDDTLRVAAELGEPAKTGHLNSKTTSIFKSFMSNRHDLTHCERTGASSEGDGDEVSDEELKKLWETGEGADIEIDCGDKRFLMHKKVLTCRCPQFKKAIDKCGSPRPLIVDLTPEAFEAFLQWVYFKSIKKNLVIRLSVPQLVRLANFAQNHELEQLRTFIFLLVCDKVEVDDISRILKRTYEIPEKPMKILSKFCDENLTELLQTEGFRSMVKNNAILDYLSPASQAIIQDEDKYKDESAEQKEVNIEQKENSRTQRSRSKERTHHSKKRSGSSSKIRKSNHGNKRKSSSKKRKNDSRGRKRKMSPSTKRSYRRKSSSQSKKRSSRSPAKKRSNKSKSASAKGRSNRRASAKKRMKRSNSSRNRRAPSKKRSRRSKSSKRSSRRSSNSSRK